MACIKQCPNSVSAPDAERTCTRVDPVPPFARVQVSVGAVALAVAYISTQKPSTTPVPPQPSSTSESAVAAAEHAILPGVAVGPSATPSVISSLDQEAKKSTATYWNAK